MERRETQFSLQDFYLTQPKENIALFDDTGYLWQIEDFATFNDPLPTMPQLVFAHGDLRYADVGGFIGINPDIARGFYGLKLKDPETDTVIARCGFIFLPDCIVITNSPQGVKVRHRTGRKQLTNKERQRLLLTDFRQELLKGIIETAKMTRCKEIIGISAENHPAIKTGNLSFKQAYHAMDEQYEKAGFHKGQNGDYYYFLEDSTA